MKNSASIVALGTYVPDRVVTNDDLSKVMDTSDEWIRTRTGIRERRYVDNQNSDDLGYEAARIALTHWKGSVGAGVKDIDTVIKATFTPPSRMSSGAAAIAAKLGIDSPFTFDVQAACTGYITALAVAEGLISSGISKNILIIGSEVISKGLNPHDRSTAILFGDGAGATVMSAAEPDALGTLGPFDLHSDGSSADILEWRGAPAMMRPADFADEKVTVQDDWFLNMAGPEVYRRAVPGMQESSVKAIEMRGWSLEDLDMLVAHQANWRIIESICKRLKLSPDKAYCNLDKYGNTSAATIPLVLADAHRDGSIKAGDKLVLTAFGAGLTWGSTTLTWPDLPPIPDVAID